MKVRVVKAQPLPNRVEKDEHHVTAAPRHQTPKKVKVISLQCFISCVAVLNFGIRYIIFFLQPNTTNVRHRAAEIR